MAFGKSPNYTEDISLYNLTREQLLAIAVESAKSLQWKTPLINSFGFVAYTKFSWRSPGEQVTIKIIGNTVRVSSECTGRQIVDYGKNKMNVQAFTGKFHTLKDRLPDDVLADIHAELEKRFHTEGEIFPTPASFSENRKKIGSISAIFIPADGFFITPLIVDLNILVFILMAISGVSIIAPDNQSIINWGANYGPLTMGGEWWRLVTNFFVHIGLLHILFNMYALVYIGILLEQHLGKLRFAAAYLLTGLAASVTSLYCHSYLVSAGASGAIFGLYGVFLALLTTNTIEKNTRKALLASIGVFVLYNLIGGMKEGVDNAAHVGGLVSGLFIGYCYYPSIKKPADDSLKIVTVTLLTVFIVAVSVYMAGGTPNDLPAYNEKLKAFTLLDTEAADDAKVEDGMSKEAALAGVTKGINCWQKGEEVVMEMDRLSISSLMHRRDKIMLKYCELRLQYCQLLYQAVDEEDPEKYSEEIEECKSRINAQIDKLKNSI